MVIGRPPAAASALPAAKPSCIASTTASSDIPSAVASSGANRTSA